MRRAAAATLAATASRAAVLAAVPAAVPAAVTATVTPAEISVVPGGGTASAGTLHPDIVATCGGPPTFPAAAAIAAIGDCGTAWPRLFLLASAASIPRTISCAVA